MKTRLSITAILAAWCAMAAEPDVRLVDAMKNRQTAAVRSLIGEHAEVNAAHGDGATALAWAAHWNEVESAELLLRAGANVNAANLYGATPLWEACDAGASAIVELLLKAKANPNAPLELGETPLMRCARTGTVEGVKALLAHGANVNAKESAHEQTALMWAAAEKHPAIVGLLLEHHAAVDAHSKHVVLAASVKKGINAYDGYYEGDFRPVAKGGYTALMFAAQSGDVESAKLLLAAGAKVNEATPEGVTALVVAAANDQTAAAEFLLDHGAHPDAADENGMTALHYTMLRGLSMVRAVSFHTYIDYLYRPANTELALALVAHGANPNARLTGSPETPYFNFGVDPVGATPFLLAATTTDIEVMKAMLAAGANPGMGTEEGMTPLMAAQIVDRSVGGTTTGRADAGSKEQAARTVAAVKMIGDAGADVTAANALGQTALHFAANRGLDAIVEYLAGKGAKVDAKDKYGQTPWNIAARVRPGGEEIKNVARLGGTPNNQVHKSTADLLVKLGAVPTAPVPSPAKRGKAGDKKGQ